MADQKIETGNESESALTEEQMMEFKEKFDEVDKDCDGKLSMVEFKTLMDSIVNANTPESELEEMLTLVGAEPGPVEFISFLNIMANFMPA